MNEWNNKHNSKMEDNNIQMNNKDNESNEWTHQKQANTLPRKEPGCFAPDQEPHTNYLL